MTYFSRVTSSNIVTLSKIPVMWKSKCVIFVLLLSDFCAVSAIGNSTPRAQHPYTVTDDEYHTGSDVANLKVLTNTQTGEYVSIIPGHGGCVDSLYLAKRPNASGQPGELHKVLWDHERNATAVRLNPTWKGRFWCDRMCHSLICSIYRYFYWRLNNLGNASFWCAHLESSALLHSICNLS